MTLVLLRVLFTLMVAYGLLVNVGELKKADAIHDRLRRARVNGLRHQTAANLVTSARYRLMASAFLTVIVGVVTAAPTPRPEVTGLAMVARLAFIGIAFTITVAGLKARAARIQTEAIIDAEMAAHDGAGAP